MAFDHGVLNIPGRTRNIEFELDRRKAALALQKRQVAKAAATQFKADKSRAVALLAELGPAIVASNASGIAKRQGVTLTQAARAINRELDSMAKWEPAKFLALVERFSAERPSENKFAESSNSEEKNDALKIFAPSAPELACCPKE